MTWVSGRKPAWRVSMSSLTVRSLVKKGPPVARNAGRGVGQELFAGGVAGEEGPAGGADRPQPLGRGGRDAARRKPREALLGTARLVGRGAAAERHQPVSRRSSAARPRSLCSA